jgi:hypothetical protein
MISPFSPLSSLFSGFHVKERSSIACSGKTCQGFRLMTTKVHVAGIISQEVLRFKEA